MLRIARLILILTTLAVLAGLPATASARIDDWQRVVRARHASATFSQLDGCDLLEVYVSASDGKYVNRHGPVNKQGLLGVLVIVRDACAEYGPKGYPVIYSADGMTLDRLGSTPKFERAWVSAMLAGTDSLDNSVELGVNLTWAPTAAFERSRVSGHGWFPLGEKHGARVNTFSHGLMAPAVAWGTLWVDGNAISLEPTHDAVLEQVRYRCAVIQHPRGGADVDC
jgi:hypothetical protein